MATRPYIEKIDNNLLYRVRKYKKKIASSIKCIIAFARALQKCRNLREITRGARATRNNIIVLLLRRSFFNVQ